MNQNKPLRLESGARREPEEFDDEIDLVGLARTVWRGKYWMAVAGFIGLAIAWYQVTYQTTPIYRATSTLALDVYSPSLVSFDTVFTGMSGDDAELQTEIAVMRSRRLIGKLVDRLNLTNDPEFNSDLQQPTDAGMMDGASDTLTRLKDAVRSAVERVGVIPPRPPENETPPTPGKAFEKTVTSVTDSITVTREEWSYLIKITAATEEAGKSALIANALAELYIEDQLESKFERMRQATDWLSGRVADLQSDVESSARELKDFVANANLISEEVLQALNLRLKEQRERLSETASSAAGLETRIAAMKAARANGAPATIAAVSEDPTLDRILPQVLTGDVAATELFGARYDQLLTRLSSDLERNRSQQGLLEQAIARQQAEIDQQSDELVKVEQLQREAEANRLLYEYFLTRLKEASVQEGVQQADGRIISPAVVPGGASNPGRNRTLAMGLLAGVLLGGALFFLKERLDRRIRTPEELEEVYPIPILGQIPKIPGWSRRAVFNYLTRRPASSASEAVRNLRTSLLLSNSAAAPQVIAITSALPGEGKTTTAFALAHNYSGLGKKVLLVEGDVRRGTFSELVDRNSTKTGLVEVVVGDAILEEATVRPDGMVFDVLLGGQTSLNPADVLSSKDFGEFLAEARKIYDLVIIDTPPLLVVPDARVISQHADAILFSVLWNKTTADHIRDAIQQITSTGLRPSGFVLGNIDPRGIRKYGYANRYIAYNKAYAKAYYRN